MRARLMTMPFSTGSAPPLRPVPEPRATKGMRSRWQTRTMAWTCAVELGSSDGQRHRAEIGQAVAFVGVEFFGRGDQVARADDVAEFGEEGGVHVGMGKDTTVGGRWGVGERWGGFRLSDLSRTWLYPSGVPI